MGPDHQSGAGSMPERGQAWRPGASVPGPKRPRWPSASTIANRHAAHPGQRTLNPRAARSRMASPAPGSQDQWSRPPTRRPGAHPKSPVPMPSRSARPAGHRYSCDDQPLMPQARHTGYLPWMRRAAAWRSRAAAPPMCLRSKRRVRWALRLQTMPGTSERSCVTPLPTSSMSTGCV